MAAATDSLDDVTTSLTRIVDYIRWGASRFVAADLSYGHGSDNAIDEAAHLVLDSLGLDHHLPDAYLASQLTRAERQAAAAVIQRRIDTRLPAPYITGKAWFAGLEFFVDERVIVPRSPIAELIEEGFQPWLGHRERPGYSRQHRADQPGRAGEPDFSGGGAVSLRERFSG